MGPPQIELQPAKSRRWRDRGPGSKLLACAIDMSHRIKRPSSVFGTSADTTSRDGLRRSSRAGEVRSFAVPGIRQSASSLSGSGV